MWVQFKVILFVLGYTHLKSAQGEIESKHNDNTILQDNFNIKTGLKPNVPSPRKIRSSMKQENKNVSELNALVSNSLQEPENGNVSSYPASEKGTKDVALSKLLLSPILEEGRIQEARNKSVTHIGNLTSYTGYFTVHKDCGSNLFFWFFPASEGDWKQAPVLVWLNGGPGASSLIGLFMEIGPWTVVNGSLVSNPHTWTKNHNVIFVDQPVGTGFSYTENECFCTNMDEVAIDMYSALIQFFTMFPELQDNKFFLTGESAAGHYLPAIAVHIHKQNQKAALKINLIGFMVGNPMIDIRCTNTADFLYELGVIDFNHREKIKEPLPEFELALKSNDHQKAFDLYLGLLGLNVTAEVELPSIFNILYETEFSGDFSSYITSDEIRSQINVGDTEFTMICGVVDQHLVLDRFLSQAPDIEYLLRTGNYILGFYAGQLDGRIPYSSLPCALRKLDWPDAPVYLNVSRTQWYVGDKLAGWVKVAGNLFEVVVRKSGHMVAHDQGEFALDLISAAVQDAPNTPLLTKLKSSK